MKIIFLFIPALLFTSTSFRQDSVSWEELEKGLWHASVNSPIKSSQSDSRIDVLRIDPFYFSFNLLCAGERKTSSKTIKEWCSEYKMIAGVNAGMFQLDGDFNTSTGYLKNKSYINNPVLNKTYNNIFCFNGKDSTVPTVRIADLRCEDWNKLKNQYESFSQCIRMLDCEGKNTWQMQEKKWSMVLLGENRSGEILFIFVRSPYRVHDYINILLGLPLQLKRLMYLEGGPEASFYINHPKLKIEKFGSYETGFTENDNNDRFWDIPNVITISRK